MIHARHPCRLNSIHILIGTMGLFPFLHLLCLRIFRLSEIKEEMIQKLFYALVKKLKYDEEYCFSKEVSH